MWLWLLLNICKTCVEAVCHNSQTVLSFQMPKSWFENQFYNNSQSHGKALFSDAKALNVGHD